MRGIETWPKSGFTAADQRCALAKSRECWIRRASPRAEQLNRWLPLVKWLLAFPQYILVGALVGSGYVVAISVQDGRAVSYSTPSLIGACVLIAAIALLFTARYPSGLFAFAVGIDRWGYRLLVYLALMTDRYPPFRLNQGSIDIEGPPQPPPPAKPGK